MVLRFYRTQVMKALGHKLIVREACHRNGVICFGVSVASWLISYCSRFLVQLPGSCYVLLI